MKKLLIITLLIIIIAVIGGLYSYHKKQRKMSLHETHHVLKSLQQGNKRFTSGNLELHNYKKQIAYTKETQHPKTIVLSCMDSRSAPEIIFDQGIGDIFTIRVAGNVINSDILGSMEFGTQVAGAKLIVVLGHTRCGAVQAACQGDQLGHLSGLLQKIQPAVTRTETHLKTTSCSDPKLVDAIAEQNVMNIVQQIPQESPIIANLLKNKKINIVGAMYDISTGEVTFLDPVHPLE